MPLNVDALLKSGAGKAYGLELGLEGTRGYVLAKLQQIRYNIKLIAIKIRRHTCSTDMRSDA